MATWWVALTSFGGLVVGARRALGAEVLIGSALALAVAWGVVLLMLGAASRRPLRDLVRDRRLVVAGVVGVAGFLVGIWLGANLAAL